MHYFKKNIGDYYKKAGRLTMLQHGAYTLLIDACYDREKFPTLEEAIEWAWASTVDEIDAVKFVLKKFFVFVDGNYQQKRVKEEIELFYGFCEQQKEKGKKGGRPKAKNNPTGLKNNPTVTQTKPNESLTINPLTINPLTINPLTINKKILASGETESVTFEQFYEAYPKKVKKFEAEKSWKRLNGIDKQVILDDIEKRKSIVWDLDDKQFIPAPSVYLNQKRWTDEIIEKHRPQQQEQEIAWE